MLALSVCGRIIRPEQMGKSVVIEGFWTAAEVCEIRASGKFALGPGLAYARVLVMDGDPRGLERSRSRDREANGFGDLRIDRSARFVGTAVTGVVLIAGGRRRSDVPMLDREFDLFAIGSTAIRRRLADGTACKAVQAGRPLGPVDRRGGRRCL